METSGARTKNFTTAEVDLLLHLVEQQSDIIKCKKTDKNHTDLKERAWRDLAVQFNASSTDESKRSSRVLKTKYLNLKANRRSRESKRAILHGTRHALTQNENNNMKLFHEKSNEISSEKEASNNSAFFDTNRIRILYNSEDPIEEVVVPEIVNEPYESWTNDAAAPRQQQLENKTDYDSPKTKNRKVPSSSWVKLAEIKAKWTEEKMKQEIDTLKAEHELRTEFLIEKHVLEKRLMLEKHELEMKILQQKLEEKYNIPKQNS